jgi:parallel beta-helix repeat protein
MKSIKLTLARQFSPVLAALALLLPCLAIGQGSLSPPTNASPYVTERALTPGGAPRPSMKTLMQIDPGEHIPSRDTGRTDLNGSLGYYNFSSPGRYYLTENLDKNIVVNSENVTIDLCGFEIRFIGAGPGPTAISTVSVLGTINRLKVINGRIRGAWNIGIEAGSDCVIDGVDISDQKTYGVKLGTGALVNGCTVHGPWNQGMGGGAGPHQGIYAHDNSVISRCTVSGIQAIGILGQNSARITDCIASNNAGCGIVAGDAASLQGCTAYNNGVTGIDVSSGNTILNCTAQGNGGAGFRNRSGASLSNCTSRYNRGEGFLAEANNVMDQTYTKNACTYLNCVAQNNTTDGFKTTIDGSYTHCNANANGTAGVEPLGGGAATSSVASPRATSTTASRPPASAASTTTPYRTTAPTASTSATSPTWSHATCCTATPPPPSASPLAAASQARRRLSLVIPM